MAFCTNSDWTIDMYKDDAQLKLPPHFLDRLFFHLSITGGNITGDVFANGVKISDVEGRCQEDVALNGATMSLKFTWVDVVILMSAVVHVDGVLRKIKGRFFSFPSEALATTEIKHLALVPPDVGDTGTATGTQT